MSLFLVYINNKSAFGSAFSCGVVYTPIAFILTRHYNMEWGNRVGSATNARGWNPLILWLMINYRMMQEYNV